MNVGTFLLTHLLLATNFPSVGLKAIHFHSDWLPTIEARHP